MAVRRLRLPASHHPRLRPGPREMYPAGRAAKRVEAPDHWYPPLRRHDEHHEPTAAGTGDLAADRALIHGALIELFNRIGTDAARRAFLRFPRVIQQLGH